MTTFTEAFTAANGSAAPSPFVANTFAGTQNVQSNAWRMVSAGSYNGTAMTYGSTNRADTETQVKLTINATRLEQYPGISCRMAGGSNGWASPFAEVNNGYIFYCDILANTVHLQKETAGSGTDIGGTGVSFTFVGGTAYQLKLQAIGTAIKAKIWDASGAEPGTWTITATDSTYTTGLNGFRDQTNTSTCQANWDDFSLNDSPGGAGTANLGTATLGITANALSSTRSVPKVDLTIAATGLTYAGRQLPSAALTVAANLLSRTASVNVSNATLALTASAISHAAQLGTAALALSANPISYADAISVIAASLGISASSLSFTDSVSAGTATVGIAARPLSDSLTTQVASLGLSANALSSTRNLGTAALALAASGMTTAGYAMASASLGIIANNLGLASALSMGTATLNVTAYNLGTQVVQTAPLGSATLSVNARNLAVALSPGLAASVAMTALALSRGASVATATVSVSALPMGQLRQATLGLASLVTQAFGLSVNTPSTPQTALLGSASVLFTASPVSTLLLLSAGLGSLAMSANALRFSDGSSSGVGSLTTTANPLSSTRQIASGILDLTAYGLGSYRPSTLGKAALTIQAYGLHIEQGHTRGRVIAGKPLSLISNGGAGMSTTVQRPTSSVNARGVQSDKEGRASTW